MENPTPALTRTEIDAMVDPDWLSLYYDLWGAGIIANDEVPEQWEAFGRAIRACPTSFVTPPTRRNPRPCNSGRGRVGFGQPVVRGRIQTRHRTPDAEAGQT